MLFFNLFYLLVHSVSFFLYYLYIATQKSFFSLEILYLVDFKQYFFLARFNTQVRVLFYLKDNSLKKNFST